MKNIYLILLFLTVALTSSAQEKFTDHLSENNESATVTLNQDSRLDDFINGNYAVQTKVKSVVSVQKMAEKQKVRGFRIQVYWGGSQKTDKTKAQQAGYRVTSLFPELSAYTSFESPHWRCRVGNFATQKEAEAYLAKIKRTRVATDPIIVKSEIYYFR